MNIIMTHCIYGLVKYAIELFFVEKPPVAMVLHEWQKASNNDIPPAMSNIVSDTVRITYAPHRYIAV